MRIRPVASTVSDNFMYLVIDGSEGLLVDPIDADAAVDAVRSEGLRTVRVLTTHGHPDHAGGNARVKELLGCEVLASGHAETFPVEADQLLREGDSLTVGSTTWQIFHAPGHTDGHIVAYTPGHLLSGDVIFVAGAGNCRFGGDAGKHYTTFARGVAELPDETRFYPGHDYAAKNLEFTLWVEPDNAEAARRLGEVASRTRADGPCLSTLGEERVYNPFFRTADTALQSLVAERWPDLQADVTNPAERTFRILRELRDAY